MPTVSLRARVAATGVAVVAIVLVGLDTFVYVSLRERLIGTLEDRLESRTTLARRLGPTLNAPELAQLAGSGVHVTVRSSDGRVLASEPDEGDSLPAGVSPHLTRRVDLPGGEVVDLSVSRSGADQTLRRLLIWEAVGTAAAVAMAALLLARTARIALRPLDQVVETARLIRAGRSGERLNPSRSNTELGRMALAFDEMLDALEAALEESRASENRSKRFLAEAAHQLRTPIAGIQASVESLPYARTRPERERLLDHVAREAHRAGRRVAALLRMARLDRGDRPERRSCDLAALCREETDRAAVLAPNLRVSFRVVNGSRTVDVDPDAIREALANMLDNARRHAVSRIEVTLVRKPNDAEVSVADDGPGLTESSAERAFEPFVVLDGHGGSGLGLTIARGTARAHGGDVTYEEGHFMLRLPMEPRAGPADTSAKSAEDAPLDRGTGALR
ncbi:MAG TPA: HAMP domain-containing sensor histidine kinase [Actinomycetota bacterium]|jgi:signal transduction histidine kinase|nr:HAMP domain-containing sensor histidine kinase [Actinomycetota bacterium]